MEVSMSVNGETRTSDVEPRTLLVHHIRDDLGLTGTNIGCDTSSCGACTIHVRTGLLWSLCTHPLARMVCRLSCSLGPSVTKRSSAV